MKQSSENPINLAKLACFNDKLSCVNIPALDGVRALAVFLVIFAHFGIKWINGGLGVLIFFVLSGFLITWLLLCENEKDSRVSLKAFYWRRMLRIFPAFYLFWIIGVIVYLLRGHIIIWPEAFSALLYYSNYYYGLKLGPSNYDLFGHTWSLCIEEQFYLLWPVLFLFGKRNLKLLTLTLIIIVLTVWVYRGILVLSFNMKQDYLYRAFDTRLDHLLLGCLMAVALKQRYLDRLIIVLIGRIWLPVVTFGILFTSQVFHYNYIYKFVFAYAFEPVLVAFLLIQLIYFSDTVMWSVFQFPIVSYLGKISYPLYLWQQLTVYTAKQLTANCNLLIQIAFSVIVTVIFASMSYYLIEKPFLLLKHCLGSTGNVRIPYPLPQPELCNLKQGTGQQD